MGKPLPRPKIKGELHWFGHVTPNHHLSIHPLPVLPLHYPSFPSYTNERLSLNRKMGDIILPESERFDGINPPVQHFLNRIKIQLALNPTRFPSEETKVLYMFSLLKGSAFDWASAMMDIEDPILHNYEEAAKALRSLYGEADCMHQAERELSELRQDKDRVSMYAARFKRIAVMVKWNEPALISHYYRGLSPRIKDALVTRKWPTTLTELIALTTRMDQNVNDGARERGLPTNVKDNLTVSHTSHQWP